MNRLTAPGSDGRVDLFCPHCDYNLTGLPENRCPECGEMFSLEQLRLARESAEEHVPPITTQAALALFFWPHLLLSLLLIPSAIAILAIVAIFAGGPIGTLVLSRRWFARRAKRASLPFSISRDRWPIIGLWLVLMLLQFGTEIAALVVVLGLLGARW